MTADGFFDLDKIDVPLIKALIALAGPERKITREQFDDLLVDHGAVHYRPKPGDAAWDRYVMRRNRVRTDYLNRLMLSVAGKELNADQENGGYKINDGSASLDHYCKEAGKRVRSTMARIRRESSRIKRCARGTVIPAEQILRLPDLVVALQKQGDAFADVVESVASNIQQIYDAQIRAQRAGQKALSVESLLSLANAKLAAHGLEPVTVETEQDNDQDEPKAA